MLISKENTAKGKYTPEFHSLLGAPPRESPRADEKTVVEDETSATSCEEDAAKGEGSPTRPAFAVFVYPRRGERFTAVTSAGNCPAFDGLDSRSSKRLVRPSGERDEQPSAIDNKRHNNS